MKITFIHHSSFLVELDTMCLLFDYTEGTLPEFPTHKPLLVFASHRHGDHYSSKIMEFQKIHESVRYVLSDDIERKQFSKEISERVTAVEPGKIYHLSISEAGKEVQVQTFRSTDEGVAFLIKAEGKTIYHAGDLNHWRWEGEPESWNEDMAKQFSAEMDKLAGAHMDVAFLPLDPRQEKNFYLGFDEFMRKAFAAHAFPMHCWGDFSVIERLKEMEVSAPYRERIAVIQQDGDSFEIS
ncbi:MBL fold metallo-hydrolase [Lacrimispora sp.]|uniref:MBL fold metallo-hydrolase n=1 Tax=Lacrimispora sp. TaxID=2719234 RepID=UPI003461629F